MPLPNVAQGDPHVEAHNAERAAINAAQTKAALDTDVKTLVNNPSSEVGAALSSVISAGMAPPTGTFLWVLFPYTNPAVARPTTPSNVRLNWSGPAGSGGVAPTNMATGDTWDMQP